MSYTWLRKCRE